jgi:hypothetical protein
MVLVVFAATFAVVRSDAVTPSISTRQSASEATNAAFRDGLYLGKLAAGRGDSFHVSRGRWATDSDRNAYAVGYERGYNELMAQK